MPTWRCDVKPGLDDALLELGLDPFLLTLVNSGSSFSLQQNR